MAALKLYKERYSQPNFNILKEEGDVDALLNKFYQSFFNRPDLEDGCFIIHVGTELADEDEDVQQFLRSYINELENLFIQLLEKHSEYKSDSQFYATNLVGLFCTSMSFCLIQSDKYRKHHINNGIKVILNKEFNYA